LDFIGLREASLATIFITADAGGSNGYRSHVWKQQLLRAPTS
jgi:hypothetical protein